MRGESRAADQTEIRGGPERSAVRRRGSAGRTSGAGTYRASGGWSMRGVALTAAAAPTQAQPQPHPHPPAQDGAQCACVSAGSGAADTSNPLSGEELVTEIEDGSVSCAPVQACATPLPKAQTAAKTRSTSNFRIRFPYTPLAAMNSQPASALLCIANGGVNIAWRSSAGAHFARGEHCPRFHTGNKE